MTGIKESKETLKEKSRRKLALQKKFGQRITIAKQGREAFLAKDYITATKKYNEYLSILSESNDVDDIFRLSPSMFDNKKDITEMLLISHVYWEVSRINEMTPKLQKTFQKSLDQFIRFTINQPYQVLNAEMLRKYIKKNKNSSRQIEALNTAYQQIFVQSKKCIISTHYFGFSHPITEDLRLIKKCLEKKSLGIEIIRYYYLISTKFTNFVEKNSSVDKLLRIIIIPFLYLLSKVSSKVLR